MTEGEGDRERQEDEEPWKRASVVVSDFAETPEEISELLGLQPTRSGRAGELRRDVLGQLTSTTLRRSYWSLNSSVDPYEPLGRHVDDLASRVSRSIPAFRRLPAAATVRVSCTIIPNGRIPSITLSCDAMRVLAEIGAPVDIDIISVEGAPNE